MKLTKYLISGVIGVSILLGGNKVLAATDPNSIVDYLVDSGEEYSFSARGELAKEYGIDNYKGTAKQNLFLLDKLRGDTVAVYNPKEDTPKPTKSQTVQPEKPVKQEKKETQEPQGKVLSVEATAYTAYCDGCSGTTYTGIDLRANPNQKVIAVDPNVIPLGAKVYVEGYGEAIAGDIGGAIKGNRIDVFIPNKDEVYKWGRKQVKVTILN